MSYVLKNGSKKVSHLESWFQIEILRATIFTNYSFHVSPPKIDKYGFLCQKSTKSWKLQPLLVVNWIQNTFSNNKGNFLKKKNERKMQTETFLFFTFPTISPIWSLKSYFQFCCVNFSVKTRAREARNATPWSAMSPGHTTQKKSAVGAGRSSF